MGTCSKPGLKQGHLEPVKQDPFQTSEHLQGRDSTACACAQSPSQLNLRFRGNFLHCPFTGHQYQEPRFVFCAPSQQVFIYTLINHIPTHSEPSLLQAVQPQLSLSLYWHGRCLHFFINCIDKDVTYALMLFLEFA